MKGAHPTLIDDLVGSPDRSYAYQPHQYFLTDAAGPWPGPLEWTYDRIGNRLTEDRNSVVDTYDYTGSPGNTALLSTVTLGVGGTRAYDYTAAGHVVEVDAGANVVDFLVDEEGRLGGLERVAGDAGSAMLYDGRGFLARVEGFELSAIFRDGFERETTECWSDGVPTPPSPGSPCSSAFRIVEPVYDSAGLLHALGITETLLGSSTERVLYLAGRPVAIARGNVGALDLLYLTTDHLGTPIAACDDSGTLLWSGGFEPFGTDWLAGTAGGASENGVWLRFPGQWVDGSWDASSSGATAAYNLFRWYEAGSGRYSRADPLGYEGSFHPYAYAEAVPTRYLDPLGLQLVVVPPPFDDGEAPPAGCTATPFVFKEFRYEDRGLEESWKLVSAKPLRIPIAARPINPAGPFRSPGTGSGALYCRCGFLPTLSRVTDRFSVWTQRVKCECDEYERTRLRFEDTHRAPAPQMLPGLQPIRFKAGAVFGDGSCGCVPPRSRRL